MLPPVAISNLIKLPGRFSISFLPALRRVAHLWILVIGGTAVGTAAEGGTNPPAFVVKSWRTGDGLPQNSVNAIAQTPDGYLWLGTQGGLARFDGVRFVTYGLNEGLKEPVIRALVEDGQGGLWIGTMGGGLSRWRDGVITTLTTADGLAHNEVMSLARAADGGLWVGTQRGLQYRGPEGFKQVGEAEGVRGLITALAVTPTDGLWLAIEQTGLFHWQNGRCEYVGAEFKARGLVPSSFLVDAEGALWIGLGNGVVARRQAGRWTEFNRTHGLPFSYIYCFAQSPSGEIWAGSHEAGLYVFREGRFHLMPGTNRSIRSLRVSREGMVWAGTLGGGLSRLSLAMVDSYPVGNPTNGAPVTGLVEEPPGHFWVGTFGGSGLFQGSLDRLEPVTGMEELKTSPFLRGGLRTRDGTVYFTGNQRLVTREPATGRINTSIMDYDPRALCEGADGSLWLGTRKGELKHLVNGISEPVTNGIFPQAIQALARSQGTALWLATRGAGLFRWDAGKVRRWTTAEGLPTDGLLALHEDAEGTLWIGTAGGGLAWLEKDRLSAVNSRLGLGDDTILQILEDEAGNLWLGCHRGIFRVSKRELIEVAAGRAAGVHPLVLDESDGMLTAECSGGYSPAGLRSQSGMLYFSTVRGIVAVDPKRFGPSVNPPKVLIEEVKLDGKPMPMRDGAWTLPPGPRELEIHYTAFNYAKPEQVHFRHRLVGRDEEWAAVEGARSVRYSQLKPGDYTFQVSAANQDQRWHDKGASLAFSVLPFYWQTIWFRIAAGCGLLASGAAAAWLAIRAKLRRAAERARAAQAIREVQERINLAVDEAVRENDKRMALAAEAANLGIWIRDLLQNEIWATDSWRALLGFTKSERIVLDGYLQKLHPEDREAVRQILTKAVESEGHYETEYRVVLPDGRMRWIASRGRVEMDRAGQPILVRGVSMDITNRKQAEHELALKRSELNHLSRVATLGELSSSLAHELNQPLTAILSNAQAAQRFLAHDDADLNELREILGDIVQEDKRAGEVIRRLRLLLKKGEVQHELIDLNEIVLEVLTLLRSDLVNHGVSAQTELAPELPAIRGDRVQLQQVLLNTVMNACHAVAGETPADRLLVVRTVTSKDFWIQVQIVDHGCGIPAESLERIFEPFYTTRTEGMGLGLAVCRTIIDAHGGKMWAENNPEQGATVSFQIPVAPEPKL